MTRDQWLTKCAAQFHDKGGMESGEAAAYAITMAVVQVADNGLNPADWDKPEDAAAEEMSCWDNDGDGPDGDEA